MPEIKQSDHRARSFTHYFHQSTHPGDEIHLSPAEGIGIPRIVVFP